MFSVVSNHLLTANHSKLDPSEEAVFRLEYHTQKRRLRRNGQGDISLPYPFLPQKPLRGYQIVLQTIKYVLAILVLLLLTVNCLENVFVFLFISHLDINLLFVEVFCRTSLLQIIILLQKTCSHI